MVYWQLIGGALLLSTVLYFTSIRFGPGLRNIPGPFLASISDADRIWSCAMGLQMKYHLKLHERYGPLVRIGPKHISFSDSSLIPQIYGITSKFWKVVNLPPGLREQTKLMIFQSDFYKMFDIKAPGGQVPTVFSVRDENRHRGIKRPIAGAYSMSTMKELEPMNDACSAILLRKLDGMVGQDIDLGKWVHWYAFDVITSITFSNRMGFMEQEEDVQNIIAAIEGRLVYNSIVGQAPYLHRYLFGNSFVTWLVGFIPALAVLNSSRHIVAFATQNLQRYQNKEFNTVHLQDMLDRFKRYRDGEQVMNDDELLSNAVSNIFAGSDTTAASLRAIFYYLCRNKEAQKKLLAEIDEADRKGELSDPVTFAESQNLRYFQAVIKEALRMHPAVGLLLERLVPAGGAEVAGIHLTEGTVIGMNPWVAARDKVVYGPDPYVFRPERWLEADEQSLKLMERNFLAFGSGTRTCLGRNISQLEISKVVPQVLRRFEFELAGPPGREWRLHCYWFVRQTGLICRVKRRKE